MIMKKIYKELILIKEELQAIRNHLEYEDETINFFVPRDNQR